MLELKYDREIVCGSLQHKSVHCDCLAYPSCPPPPHHRMAAFRPVFSGGSCAVHLCLWCSSLPWVWPQDGAVREVQQRCVLKCGITSHICTKAFQVLSGETVILIERRMVDQFESRVEETRSRDSRERHWSLRSGAHDNDLVCPI